MFNVRTLPQNLASEAATAGVVAAIYINHIFMYTRIYTYVYI